MKCNKNHENTVQKKNTFHPPKIREVNGSYFS